MNENSINKRILFVGLNTIDLQFRVDEFPEENTKVKARHNTISVGGPATNAAVACAHLGSNTDLFTPIGIHSLTEFIQSDLKQHHVAVIDPVSECVSQPIFASIISTVQNGGRTIFSYHPDKLIDSNIDLTINFNNYKLIMFDGFYPEYAIPLAQKAHEHNITTVFDGGSWKPGLDELLNYIDIAICSNDFNVPKGKVFDYLGNKGIKHIAITRGENSILFYDESQNGEIHPESINAADTLGAGDFFHGAFCHYYSTGSSFQEALKQASNVAARSCLSFGTREWLKVPK